MILSLCKILQFSFRFGQSGKAWSETTLRKVSAPAIALRLDSKPPGQPAKALADLPEDLELSWGERIARATEGALEAEISHLSLSANSSVLAKLGDWVQDEVVPAPLPTWCTVFCASIFVLTALCASAWSNNRWSTRCSGACSLLAFRS